MRVATKKGGVQVGQWLVEERLQIRHDGAADGDALALSTRHRLWQAVEIFGQLEDFRGLLHALVDLGLAFLAVSVEKAMLSYTVICG